MIEVRLGTNWYVLRIILLELSRQNFLSPVTVPPKITVRELHCGLLFVFAQKKKKAKNHTFEEMCVCVCFVLFLYFVFVLFVFTKSLRDDNCMLLAHRP